MEDIIEEWRTCDLLLNYYLVSDLGRIKNPRTGKILKQQVKKGKMKYSCIRLWFYGKTKKNFSVHRLVAQALPDICGEWFEGCVINHKDCNPLNNSAYNLEVCTQKYNANYGDCNIKRSLSHINNPKKSKPVAKLNLHYELIETFPSASEAARQTGLHCSAICNCCNNKKYNKTHGGFIWRYV